MGMGRKPRVSRCGPEARAPAGLHDAGRRPAPPRGCTGRESSAVGAGCSSVALRWWIVRSAKIVLDIKFIRHPLTIGTAAGLSSPTSSGDSWNDGWRYELA